MKRIILSASLFFLTSFAINANPIDAQQAKQIARTTLLENVEHGTRKLALGNVEMKVIVQDKLQQSPAYFVCVPASGEGFVIVSGDDSEDAVLGYSIEGNIDINNMPPVLCEILDGYSNHIAQVRSGDAQAYAPISSYSGQNRAKSVSALCKSNWAQASPYYNMCPTDNETHCLVGCTATATSQIMYYHKYPVVGTGTVSTRYNGNTLQLNLNETPFDWDNMIDSYKDEYTDEQANAVATLCQAVGYSVKMNYGIDFSGAYLSDALDALINNFNYSTTAKIYLRDSYSDEGWLNKLKAELEEGRPMIYAGYTTSMAGHSFICDGFNFKDLVHINWGWAGDYNGFYNFRILSPNKAKPEEGYSQMQQALMGIQPMLEDEDRTIQYQIILKDSISYTQDGNNFVLRLPGLTNESYTQASGTIHYVIFNAENEEVDNIRLCNYNGSVDVQGRAQSIDFSIPSSLPDGDYNLILAFKPQDSTKWYWLETGDMLAKIRITIANSEVTTSEIVTNGIKNVTVNEKTNSDIIYNLQGQRIENPQHGLFIKNGKKILLK